MTRQPRNQPKTVGDLETLLRLHPREVKLAIQRDGKTIPVTNIVTAYQTGSGGTQVVITLKTEN